MNNDYRPPACPVSFHVTRNTFTINIGLSQIFIRMPQIQKEPLTEMIDLNIVLRNWPLAVLTSVSKYVDHRLLNIDMVGNNISFTMH